MNPRDLPARIAALPKAELHLHLEGCIRPRVAQALAFRHGIKITEEEVSQRYAYRNFAGFIEAFKWVTSFLGSPNDFALLAKDVCEQLLEQNVVYAEVTLSVGVMLIRGQNPQANFEAILEATQPFEQRGLRLNWIFDAVRQFGPEPASQVVEWAHQCASPRIVAFGIGGDEMSVATKEFQRAYKSASEFGLHRVIHAGEIGGPEKIREAIELLQVERIGHGIAAFLDSALMDLLAEKRIPLEICPVSNLRTGALAKQIHPRATLRDHPIVSLSRHGIPVVLSTDDPAMFHTSLLQEYAQVFAMGMNEDELAKLVQQSFDCAFASSDGHIETVR